MRRTSSPTTRTRAADVVRDQLAATPSRARRRRDRPRLPLRLLAARRPAGGLSRAGPAGARAASCRSSSTRARPTRTRWRFCARKGGGELRGVLHCFTGTPALARAGLDLGLLHLAGRHRDVPEGRASCARRSRRVPLDRLLTETDSPFLAPVPHRGKRNEPALRRARRRRARPQLHGMTADGARPRGRRRISTRCSGRDKVPT